MNIRTLEKQIFIGGPKDGEVLEFKTDGRRYINIPIVPKLRVIDDMSEGSGIYSVCYRCERLHAFSVVANVWVENSLTLDEAMETLIENYRPIRLVEAP